MKKFLHLLSASIALAFAIGCVEDDVYGPALIGNVLNTPAATSADTVTVTATIVSNKGVAAATLLYAVGEGMFNPVAMTNDSVSLTTYSAQIPPQAMDTTVTFFIQALNIDGEMTLSNEYSYVVGEVPVDYTGLRLNELNGNDKFIEIYNSSASDINIGGVYIQKDGTGVWTSTSAILGAGEFLLLYSEDVVGADGAQEGYDPDLVFTSGLSAKKAVKVELFSPRDTSLDLFNLVTFSVAAPASYSFNDNLVWAYAAATPGYANVQSIDYVQGLQDN